MDRLLRADQVVAKAHDLGLDDITENWVEYMVRAKRLPFTIISKKRRFAESVVDELFAGYFAEATA